MSIDTATEPPLPYSFVVAVNKQLMMAYHSVNREDQHMGCWGVPGATIEYARRGRTRWTLWYAILGPDRPEFPARTYLPRFGNRLSELIAWHLAYRVGHPHSMMESNKT